jgi:NAD(P)-dependent dehydrogenase (short-subunit alcohol dehydrogenase family)
MSKIALVTGGSRGLGRNAALSIARHGGDVIITYQARRDAADAVVAEITAMGRKAIAFDAGDVSNFAPFAGQLRTALRKEWSRDAFDHLVNNAGHGEYALIGETTEAQFDGLVHLKGVLFLTQTLLPLIADGGRIVNLSSGLTRICAPGWAAYAAVKGAVEVLTVYMAKAKELGSRRIAVNTVAPGAIETDFFGGAVRDTPEFNKLFAEMTALGRVGLPDDIGPMIASLLSEENRWINAQRIEVSGGQGI